LDHFCRYFSFWLDSLGPLGIPLILLVPVLVNLGLAVLTHSKDFLLIELVLNALIAPDVVVHIEHERERDAVVDLNSLHRLPVEGETCQVDEKDRGAVSQLQAFLSIHLLLALLTLVLVRAI
jgi:hypothetical protein